MPKEKQFIRKMTVEDLKEVINWAEAEGWNPGIYDAECFFNTDHSGFYTGEVDGEMVSAISIVKYKNHFAFLGLYLVKPEYRGNGFGIDLWNHAIGLHGTYNIGLDGVSEQQANYRKSGFMFAHRNIRYRGIKSEITRSVQSMNLGDIPFETLCQYDRRCFPSERTEFLRTWISREGTRGYGIMEANRLKGFGVIRKCVNGYKIGPLFADTAEMAENLFLALIDPLEPGVDFFLDIPEINRKATELVLKYKMENVFETARMYTKEVPDLSTEKIFGITSFELG
ncbi:MAG TPA: GNAT family N-acetyltransferase [Thermotogota bacterium]|nr:GNAT family N-acetyltransferase [Thermotogota bacterium]HPJ87785.1 GNAT family N-acetyltransferase [Thermotogota bacterium]HPR95217.1 GNAT family N-acetyltransferase [Thermotogota bacterium]